MDVTGAEREATDRPAPFRARSLILGFLLCIPAAMLSAQQPVDSMFSLMVAPISILILLLIINLPFKLFLPKLSLGQSDLIMIFAITSVAATVSGEWSFVHHSAIQDLPAKAATSPVVKDQIMAHLPDWLVEKDKKFIEDVANGGREAGYVLQQMPRLFPKYLAWGMLFFAICFAMLCVNSLMRGSWLKRERLAFPIIQLPIAMTEGGGLGRCGGVRLCGSRSR